MTIHRFREIKHSAERSGKCTICGKRRVRRKTFWQTLNPFNKRSDGGVKDEQDIRQELLQEAIEWRDRPFVCRRCEQEQP